MGGQKVPGELQGNDRPTFSNARGESEFIRAVERDGEQADQTDYLSLARIDTYSDEHIENELRHIWGKLKFRIPSESIDQVTKVCKALIQIDKNVFYSKSVNSSMGEAKKCVNELIQRIRKYREKTSVSQLNQGVVNELWNVGVKGLDFAFKAVNSLVVNHQAIKSPCSIVVELIHEISREHKKQILTISYLIDKEIENLDNLNLTYIENVLGEIYDEIDDFQFSSRNRDWKSGLGTDPEPHQPGSVE